MDDSALVFGNKMEIEEEFYAITLFYIKEKYYREVPTIHELLHSIHIHTFFPFVSPALVTSKLYVNTLITHIITIVLHNIQYG